ncbi:MAG: phosphatase PAP2 family protein [Alphaproteobacteria bacterium]|nr:phosphatase PAP2 family protein [Alphaproteobacteria bacterium]
MIGRAAVALFAATALAAMAAAAEADDPYRLDNPDYWKSYADNAGRIMATPFAGQEVDWERNALLLAAIGGAFLVDDDVERWMKRHRSAKADTAASVAASFGTLNALGPALAGGYALGRATDDAKLQETALLGAESLVLASAFAEGIKRGVGRDRPNEPDQKVDKADFNGPHARKDGSFPSGHTTAAFSVAAVVAAEYEQQPAVGAAAYGIAGLTGLSRLYDREHWLSDVVAGAGLGTGVGLLVHHFRPFGPQGGALSFAPGAGSRPAGLTVTARF